MTTALPVGGTTYADSTELTPCAKNFYGVNFTQKEQDTLLRIKPYIPSDNEDLIDTCRNAYTESRQKGTVNETGAVFLQHQDALRKTFTRLEPKDLCTFALVSKSCYYFTKKVDHIWGSQFRNTFPSISPLSKEKSCYSTEQQFKIYFNRFNRTLRPYREKFNQKKNNLNRMVEIAENRFEAYGGQAAHARFLNALHDAPTDEAMKIVYLYSSDAKAYQAFGALAILLRIRHQGCSGYDNDAIHPDTHLGRCLKTMKRCLQAINTIPSTFDNQEMFEECIQKPEVAANNRSEYTATQDDDSFDAADPFGFGSAQH